MFINWTWGPTSILFIIRKHVCTPARLNVVFRITVTSIHCKWCRCNWLLNYCPLTYLLVQLIKRQIRHNLQYLIQHRLITFGDCCVIWDLSLILTSSPSHMTLHAVNNLWSRFIWPISNLWNSRTICYTAFPLQLLGMSHATSGSYSFIFPCIFLLPHSFWDLQCRFPSNRNTQRYCPFHELLASLLSPRPIQ